MQDEFFEIVSILIDLYSEDMDIVLCSHFVVFVVMFFLHVS